MKITAEQRDKAYLIIQKLKKNTYLIEKDMSLKNNIGDVITGISMASLVQYGVYHGGNVIVYEKESETGVV